MTAIRRTKMPNRNGEWLVNECKSLVYSCLCVGLVAGLVILHNHQEKITSFENLESTRFVRNVILRELEDYHQKVGKYPPSLRDMQYFKPSTNFLAIEEHFFPFDLKRFSYKSDTGTFAICWKSELGSELCLSSKKRGLKTVNTRSN